MGTPSALLTRFPVSRETLEHIRNAEESKRRARGQPGEREEREKEDVQRAETEEQNIEYIEETAEGGDTNEKGLEPENPGASHDPGGSWLTKPQYSAFTDLGKKKEYSVTRSEETTAPKNPSADYNFF
ncbi:hypothetical protein NDU88_006655 [Pleurodeles waltl]|uniref:Uncharacterized protein n=1 Tax=Pleurodeles waltl TaxID=8319 RepID=A0AAV7UM41_PLEWA|nr:hypothetical protein NDU88_006655 [Pleurodeles waltl]